jgi:magnesium transporter
MVYGGTSSDEPIRLSVIEYSEEEHVVVEEASLSDCLAALRRPTVAWVDVQGLHDLDVIRELGSFKSVHRLVLEDVVHLNQRPKLEEYSDFLFMVVRMLIWDPETDAVRDEQVSLIIGHGFVISFQERRGDVFEPVRERMRRPQSVIRSGRADYLAYALVDAIVDNYFEVIGSLSDRIEELEERVLTRPDPDLASEIHRLRREASRIRRSIWPLREVLSNLYRGETEFIEPETRIYLRDVYDHSVQVVDILEAQRELLGGLMDLYLTGVSNRMNEVMKVLTMIATIFIPLSFLAGLYGMNFDFMPELHFPWAYPTLLLVMAALGGGMLMFFRRRGWF